MTQQAEWFFKYFPFTATYRQWGFCVVSSGYSKIPPQHPYPPAVHPDHHNFSWQQGRTLDSFTFVYISQGKGVFESEVTGSISISEGSVFIVFPNIWHRYKPDPDTGWHEYWIEFTGTAAENFMSNSLLDSSAPLLTIRNNAKLTHTFLDVIELLQHQPHGFEYLLSSQAFSLLTLLITEKDTQKDEDLEKTEIIRKARQALLTDFGKPVDLKQLSSELGMSYSLFRKTFKTITGFSPYQYRLDFRLYRAAQLLKVKDLQIGQIAENMGFASIYHFSELFKKKTGMTPLEYRRQFNRSP